MSLDVNIKPEWELLDFVNEPDESLLFDSIASEFNDISGFPIEYFSLDVTAGNLDDLYGENPTMEWAGSKRSKILYEPTTEVDLMNVFGMSSDDTIINMQMTKSVFKRDISLDLPKIGDLIKTLWNNKIYEIVSVKAEDKIFKGTKLIWDFICRPYRYNSQSDSADDIFNSIPDVDDFPDTNFITNSKELSAFGDNEFIDELQTSNLTVKERLLELGCIFAYIFVSEETISDVLIGNVDWTTKEMFDIDDNSLGTMNEIGQNILFFDHEVSYSEESEILEIIDNPNTTIIKYSSDNLNTSYYGYNEL